MKQLAEGGDATAPGPGNLIPFIRERFYLFPLDRIVFNSTKNCSCGNLMIVVPALHGCIVDDDNARR